MKQSFFFILIFLLNVSIASSQEIIIKGSVSDSLNNPIEYSSIGLLNKSVGTVTNEKGNFTLIIDETMEQDTLRISCLGYKPKEVLIQDIIKKSSLLNFQLESFTEKLDEVVLSSKSTKIYKTGKLKTKTKNQVIFANPDLRNKNLGSEIGKKFKLGEDKASFLKEFKFFIKTNNFDNVKFRINIYSIKNNKPDKKLNQENIFAEAGKNYTDWINTDLTPYNIIVRQDIIITVEWVEHSDKGDKLNLPMIIPSFGSTHYYKFGSQNSWKKYGSISSSMYLIYKQ